MWIPVFLLGYWGFTYFRQCVLSLTGSSRPVEYVMATKGGNLKFRAESVQVTLSRNIVSLSRVTIHEPNGKLLASVREVLLTAAIPEHLNDPPTPTPAYPSN